MLDIVLLSMPAHKAYSPFVIMACLLLLGVQAAMSTSIAYCYLNEMVPSRLGSSVSAAWLAGEGGVQILHVLYYKYMSKNWRWLIVYTACQSLVVLTVHLSYMPESPKWLYNKRKFKECREVFEKMAKVNRTQLKSGALLLTCSLKQAFEEGELDKMSDASLEREHGV